MKMCIRDRLTVVPWDTPAEEVLAMAPDGVFLSNGPGDPEAVELSLIHIYPVAMATNTTSDMSAIDKATMPCLSLIHI